MKTNKMPEFYMIFDPKINKNSGILHHICPKNAQIFTLRLPEKYFARILGEGEYAPLATASPTPMLSSYFRTCPPFQPQDDDLKI